MKALPISTDKIAISLSTLCVIHCLSLPLLVGLLPSFTVLSLHGEAFHFWMVVAVIPISLFALQMGCKKHKKLSIAMLGITGLVMLLLAVLFGESHLGEIGEKTLTILGAIMIAISHVKNFRLCRTIENCPCPEDK